MEFKCQLFQDRIKLTWSFIFTIKSINHNQLNYLSHWQEEEPTVRPYHVNLEYIFFWFQNKIFAIIWVQHKILVESLKNFQNFLVWVKFQFLI